MSRRTELRQVIGAATKALASRAGQIATWTLITLSAADVIFICWVSLWEHPLVLDKRHWYDAHFPFVQYAVFILVLALLAAPLVWIYNVRFAWKLSEHDKSRSAERHQELLIWLTSVSVPYLVLGLAMIIEIRTMIDEPAKASGALAAIMILYALTVIASFLYLEVRELKQTFSRELANASDWFKISLALAETKAGEAAPAVAIKKLLWTWHDIYTDASGATPHLVNPTRRTLVGTLLSSYVSEEIADARANLNPQRIPRTVRLPTTTDVMYLATNVGFYASFLAEALKRLGLLSDRGVPSIATVTYALPAFWWNWPKVTPHGEYHDYQPISAFRWTLEQLVGSDMAIYDPKTCDHLLTLASGHSLGQVFRRVIVSDDSWTSSEKALVTEAQWKKSTGWKILLQKPSQENPHGRVAHSMSMDLTTGDRAHLISGLQWTNGLKGKEAYWIIDADTEREGFVARDLLQFFRERMHAGSRGNTLIMPISQPIFESPFFVDPDEKGDQGLNGCSEITFLGLCKDDCKDAWTDDRDWGDWGEWGLALLSTMSPGTETMFVTAVHGDETMQRLWRSVKSTVARMPAPIWSS